MPAAEKKTLSAATAPAAKKRGKFGFVVVVLLLAGAGVWFFIFRKDPSAAEAGAQPQVRSTLHLDTFVLNLSDPDQRSYLRVGIDLGLNREEKRGEVAPIAEVRDTILGVLAQGKVDELLTATGKTKLKQELLAALQQRLPQLGVEEVYFTEFLIQR
jgi:flagellar basal body-associated protein FliL